MGRQDEFNAAVREKTAQVRVKKGRIVEGRSAGTVFWTTPARARLFMDQNAVELIGEPVAAAPGPTESKPVEGATEGKSYDAPSNGHSTGSASSNASGKDEPLSASEEAQVSAPLRSNEFETPEPQAPAELSQSTTRTSSPRGQTSSTSQTPAGGNGTGTRRRSRSSQE
jgi:hypothetical protein